MPKNPENSQPIPTPEEQSSADQELGGLPMAHEELTLEDAEKGEIQDIDASIAERVEEVKNAREKLHELDPNGLISQEVLSGHANPDDDNVLEIKAQLMIIDEGSKFIRSQVQRTMELSGRREEIAKKLLDPNKAIHGEFRVKTEKGERISPADLAKLENDRVEHKFQEAVQNRYSKVMEGAQLRSSAERLAEKHRDKLNQIKQMRKNLMARMEQLGLDSDRIVEANSRDREVQLYTQIIDEDSDAIYADVVREVETEAQARPEGQKFTPEQIEEEVNSCYNTIMREAYLK